MTVEERIKKEEEKNSLFYTSEFRTGQEKSYNKISLFDSTDRINATAMAFTIFP